VSFIVDSGATDHLVTGKETSKMCDIELLSAPISIKVANGDTIHPTKRGVLKLKACSTVVNIKPLIVEGLTHNLLSVKKLSDSGFDITFKKDKAVISNNKNFRLECMSEGGLYTAQLLYLNKQCNVTTGNELWHRRLGHLNNNDLKRMNHPTSEKLCDPCLRGKAKRLPFPSVIK